MSRRVSGWLRQPRDLRVTGTDIVSCDEARWGVSMVAQAPPPGVHRDEQIRLPDMDERAAFGLGVGASFAGEPAGLQLPHTTVAHSALGQSDRRAEPHHQIASLVVRLTARGRQETRCAYRRHPERLDAPQVPAERVHDNGAGTVLDRWNESRSVRDVDHHVPVPRVSGHEHAERQPLADADRDGRLTLERARKDDFPQRCPACDPCSRNQVVSHGRRVAPRLVPLVIDSEDRGAHDDLQRSSPGHRDWFAVRVGRHHGHVTHDVADGFGSVQVEHDPVEARVLPHPNQVEGCGAHRLGAVDRAGAPPVGGA